jgi:hypothetical protein
MSSKGCKRLADGLRTFSRAIHQELVPSLLAWRLKAVSFARLDMVAKIEDAACRWERDPGCRAPSVSETRVEVLRRPQGTIFFADALPGPRTDRSNASNLARVAPVSSVA